MAEPFVNKAEFQPEKRPVIRVKSDLEKLDGSYEDLDIELLPDGKPKAVVFFDVDKTLVRFRSVYREAISKLFPQEPDKDKLFEVYESNFQLGSSRGEMIRMKGIYLDGREDWIDSKVYEEEYFSKHRGEINHPGHELYDVAGDFLRKFDDLASGQIVKEYKQDPKSFESIKIRPIYHLAEIYKRLGIPMVCMSANPGKFIEAACKYLGLSEYFIDSASDWDVDGDKEYKIQYLIGELEKKDIKVPYDRLIIVGDSIKGDIGSGLRFKDMKKDQENVNIKGLLVVENQNALAAAEEKVRNDTQLQKLVKEFDVKAVQLDKVSFSSVDGKPRLSSHYQNDFMKDMKI